MFLSDHTLSMITLVTLFIHGYSAFIINVGSAHNDRAYQHSHRTSCNRYYRTSYKAIPEDKAFSLQECLEIQQLIVSLSLEPSDQMRRDRLSMLYTKKISNPDYKRFVDLFDQTLIEMGTVIQESAKKQAINKMQNVQKDNDDTAISTSNGSEGYMSLNRSLEERQLWAMVDMMVQSKVLAKQNNIKLDDFQ